MADCLATEDMDHFDDLSDYGNSRNTGRGYWFKELMSRESTPKYEDELNKKFIPDYDLIDKEAEMAIRKCLNKRSSSLDIRNSKCVQFPEILKECIFITTIIADNCHMIKVINVPPSVKVIDLEKNLIEEVRNEDLPEDIKYIRLFNNELTYLDLSKKMNLKKIDLRKINFNTLREFKLGPNLEKIDLEHSVGIKTDFLMSLNKLKFIDVSQTDILDFTDIPDSVAELYANKLNSTPNGRIITKLPKNLVEFECKDSGIKEFKFDKFPMKLRVVKLLYNKLEKLPQLPDTIEKIDVERNELTDFPPLPLSLQWIDITNNKFSDEKLAEIEEKATNLRVKVKRIRNNRSPLSTITPEMRAMRERERELKKAVRHLCEYSYERDRSKCITLSESVVI